MGVRDTLWSQGKAWVFLCVGVLACVLLLYSVPLRSVWHLVKPPPPPPPWYVDTANRRADEVQHVVFVKVHKAASSTLYNIFVRFSISRELNVMFPREGNLLGETSHELYPLVEHPPSPPFLFDLLCNHVVFDEEMIRPFFPEDTVYVAVLREPFSQMQSAYYYFRNRYRVNYLTKSANNFTEFLTRTHHYEPEDPLRSYTNNRMSVDLGLPPRQIRNSSYIATFLQHVDKVFDLVLIADRFDESMVLLKRRLRWTLEDVLYMKLNKRRKENRQQVQVPALLKARFQEFDQFDVALYDYFSEQFNLTVLGEGPEFQEEVNTFGSIEEQVQSFCEGTNRSRGNLTVPESKWNKQFVVKAAECEALAMEEVTLDDRAKYWQQVRMKSRGS